MQTTGEEGLQWHQCSCSGFTYCFSSGLIGSQFLSFVLTSGFISALAPFLMLVCTFCWYIYRSFPSEGSPEWASVWRKSFASFSPYRALHPGLFWNFFEGGQHHFICETAFEKEESFNPPLNTKKTSSLPLAKLNFFITSCWEVLEYGLGRHNGFTSASFAHRLQ